MAVTTPVCKGRFQESMRQRLEAAGEEVHVYDAQVDPNFTALGRAVFEILTIDADSVSDATADAAFWTWITAVSNWLTAVQTWQVGVRTAVSNWTPTDATDVALKSAILTVTEPGAPPAPPTSLRVDIR